MATIFDKFNSAVDLEGLRKDVQEAGNGNGEYDEIPVGTYEMKPIKGEVRENSKHLPMVSIRFRIVSGEYKNRLVFYNQTITQGFQIGIVNKFLRDLDVLDEVEFRDYGQYHNLIMDAVEAVEENGLTYKVEYGKKNDFPTFAIKEVFEN